MDPVMIVAALVLLVAAYVLYRRFTGGGSAGGADGFASASGAPAGGAAASATGAGAGAGADKPEEPKGEPIFLYFGSQTATAEGFAKTMSDEARGEGFAPTVVDLEDWDVDEFVAAGAKGQLSLFFMATYGEGEPTDNARDFNKWLMDKEGALEPSTLAGHRFSVFGLGNKQYEHYNKMGKDTNARLEALGATRVYKYGEGDDDGSLEDDFEAWKEGVWEALREATGMGGGEAGAAGGAGGPGGERRRGSSAGGEAALHPLPPLRYDVKWLPGKPEGCSDDGIPLYLNSHAGGRRSNNNDGAAAGGAGSGGDASAVDPDKHVDPSSRPYFIARPAKVVVNRELRASADGKGSTVHVELSIKSTDIRYTTADNLALCPENDPAHVEALARWLGYDLDAWFTLEPLGSDAASRRHIFPTPTTVRAALTRYCDINNMPRKAVLGVMAHFASEKREQERLLRLTSKEGKEEFGSWVVEHRRALYEVFEAFPSCKMPFGRFLETVPRLQPRYYTISSSSVVHPERVHLTVAVVNEKKPHDGSVERHFVGVASNQLARARPPATVDGKLVGTALGRDPWPVVRAFVRPSTFALPNNASTPVIMVGPGTGLAPMRAFLQERRHQKEAGATLGETVLFFGCRHRAQDFIYEDELLGYARDRVLTHFYTAFSREGPSKDYVQHHIEREGETVWRLLQAGAHVYVCGGIKMGNDVMATIEQVAASRGGMTEEAAKKFVKDLQAGGRYVQELWS